MQSFTISGKSTAMPIVEANGGASGSIIAAHWLEFELDEADRIVVRR